MLMAVGLAELDELPQALRALTTVVAANIIHRPGFRVFTVASSRV
jgi:hypothetical protein